jgi:hypothetical protein
MLSASFSSVSPSDDKVNLVTVYQVNKNRSIESNINSNGHVDRRSLRQDSNNASTMPGPYMPSPLLKISPGSQLAAFQRVVFAHFVTESKMVQMFI